MQAHFMRFRKAWENWLRGLAKANEQSFGSGRVDCCGLGKTAEKEKRV